MAAPALLVDLLSNSIISQTFGIEAAISRCIRFVRPACTHLLDYHHYLSYSFNVMPLQNSTTRAILFLAYNELEVQDVDKIWDGFTPWCVLDMVTEYPTHIIPSRLFIPYAGTLRCEGVLEHTDMIPIFLDEWTAASSLKVVLNLLNYLPYETQIQLRSSAIGNISVRRLARLVASKVICCLKRAEEQNATMRHWEAPRWVFGSSSGLINAADVVLLGVVFVLPGKITPLLQVREDAMFTT
ncbi:hypothetical protein PENSPDRAFT_756765 [Peniophora sp. CONT]|nr:hypothetical protein PENSPDRAFT_756765 [Peniophora sp. CONT]